MKKVSKKNIWTIFLIILIYILISFFDSYKNNTIQQPTTATFLHYKINGTLIFLIAGGLKLFFLLILFLYLVYIIMYIILFLSKKNIVTFNNIFISILFLVNILISIILSTLTIGQIYVFSFQFIDALIFWNIILISDLFLPMILILIYKLTNKFVGWGFYPNKNI